MTTKIETKMEIKFVLTPVKYVNLVCTQEELAILRRAVGQTSRLNYHEKIQEYVMNTSNTLDQVFYQMGVPEECR
jgi:hypothetical protein